MYKALLVDDHEELTALLGRILAHEGFSTSTAGDGAQAIAQAKEERPDVILMDLEMPGLDGIEAIRRLKLDPETAEIPILVLTGKGTRENLARAERAGASFCLQKATFHLATFVSTLRILVGRRAGRVEALDLPGDPSEPPAPALET